MTDVLGPPPAAFSSGWPSWVVVLHYYVMIILKQFFADENGNLHEATPLNRAMHDVPDEVTLTQYVNEEGTYLYDVTLPDGTVETEQPLFLFPAADLVLAPSLIPTMSIE